MFSLHCLFALNFLIYCSAYDVCDSQECGIQWYDFDWKAYINKDWKPEVDAQHPARRFGIDLKKSIEIGVNRTIPDNRHEKCQSVKWEDQDVQFADASIIITFRDEPRSTLLRTIVSVIERSPPKLLKEIILIDDNNDDITVGDELKVISKVRVIRNEVREGLIRSRVKATKAAKGQTLVFLDSHCEVQNGWLEPLLARIADNPKRLVSPVIENINLYDYQFESVSTFLRGGFDWRLDFFWEWLPARDRYRQLKDPTTTFKTPAIAGGLFAISRDWFMKLGIYDEGMEIWGGENIELSLRMWTCGGEMEIVPCSKVGHIYKLKNVYSYPKGMQKTTDCNNQRVAQVWLDGYKIIYETVRGPQTSEEKEECGDISDRVKLRKDLKCHSFSWYLENIYPEMQIPIEGDIAFGGIHYSQPTLLSCIDSIALGEESVYGGNSCLQTFPPQQFRMNSLGQISQNDFCLTISQVKTGAQVLSSLCSKKESLQQFEKLRPKKKKKSKLRGYLLKSKKYDLCLDASAIKTSGLMVLRCDETSANQRFLFAYNFS